MGKNTMMRKCIREYCERKGDNAWDVLEQKLVGNVGVAFTKGDLSEVRAKIAEYVVPRARACQRRRAPRRDRARRSHRHGALADWFLPGAQYRHQDQQGVIEILSDVTVVTKDEKVTSSCGHAARQDGLHPFFYGLETLEVYDKGNMFDVKVLDIDDAKLGEMFAAGLKNIAALSLAANYPTVAAVPRAHQRLQEHPRALHRHGLHLPPRGEGQGVPRQPRRLRRPLGRRRRTKSSRCCACGRGGGGGKGGGLRPLRLASAFGRGNARMVSHRYGVDGRMLVDGKRSV